MSVETKNPEYEKMINEWRLVRACSAGQREVKKLKTFALPAPDTNGANYDKDRYEAYIKRAIFTNVTGRTKNGLTGAAFRKLPEVQLSPTLDYLSENADGAGQSLIQLTKDVMNNVWETGRDGALVDYPTLDTDLTLEQQRMLDPKAYIKRYKAENIINWKTMSVGGKLVTNLVVLKEQTNKSDDEFDHSNKDQYRVLRLRSDGYTQQLYEDGEPVEEERYPTKSGGEKWDFIPFFFFGAANNDPSVDDIPIADIAHVNLGHYRNSADLEENCFIHSQLTLGISTDLDADTWKAMNPKGVVVGARTGHYLGPSGAFHSVQAGANQLADTLMERKEHQMLALGAKLVEQKNTNETAAAARIDATGENSVLADIVTNVEEGIRKCIEWCGMFQGDESENEFTMNREFFPDDVNPQLIMASIQLLDRGIIGKEDVRTVSRKANIISEDRTDEDIDNDVANASPMV